MSSISRDNPCNLSEDLAYYYDQVLVNVPERYTDFCEKNKEKTILIHSCNAVHESCSLSGCGYNGVACSQEAYDLMRESWSNSQIFGSFLLGALCSVFILWFARAVKIMLKENYDNGNNRLCPGLSFHESNSSLERKRKK